MPRNEKSAAVVGRVLKSIREEHSLTQQEVALRSGVDRAYLSEVENGKRSLSIDRLLKVCGALRIKASTVVGRIERELDGP